MKKKRFGKKALIWAEVFLLVLSLLSTLSFSAAGEESKTMVGIAMDRPALELLPGETDTLSVIDGNGVSIPAFWSTTNKQVVTVSQNGEVTAVGVGEAMIIADVKGGESAVCNVFVVEKRKNVFEENITISTFWPPVGPDYITEEQYRWMAEAGITYVMGAGSNVGDKEDQMKMLSWCYKYGMQMMVGDIRMGPNMAKMSEDELAALLNEYKNVPGVAGWWLIDEPGAPLDYTTVYARLKKLAPDKEVYLNFLPGSGPLYCNQVDDFLRVLKSKGTKADYYQYDSYNCFLDRIDYNRELDGLTNAWRLGRDNDVKTAAFILSVGHLSYRQPNENELRWQMNVSLAYGIKLVQYFTWFCPSDYGVKGEERSIINYDGKKTAIYDAVSRINHETLEIGKTLIDLDAVDVRVNGRRFLNLPITSDSNIQPVSDSEFVASFMRNPETHRNYLMLVSNETERNKTITVSLNDRITGLELIGNGTEQTWTLDKQQLTVQAKPGEAFLFALPEGVDLYPDAADVQDGENLVTSSYVYATKTDSGEKAAISKVADGIRFQNEKVIGWSYSKGKADLIVDFGKERTFNRVDLYPTGVGERFGETMPVSFDLQVSDNGTKWTTVKTITDYRQDGFKTPSYTIDPVTARYFRLHVTEAGENGISLCELEIYNDDGSVPAAEHYQKPPQEKGDNIAGKAYLSATATRELYGWSLQGLTDGYRSFSYDNMSAGYCNDAVTPCCVTLDFGIAYKMDTIKLWPAMNTYVNNEYMECYPAHFTFDVSNDGENWTTVYEAKDFAYKKKGSAVTFTFDEVEARYLRWSILESDFEYVCVGEMQVFWNDDHKSTETTAPDTDAPTEPPTDPVTEPVTEPVTRPTETVNEETSAPVDETQTGGKTGCKSSVVPLVGAAVAAAAAVGIKKKH